MATTNAASKPSRSMINSAVSTARPSNHRVSELGQPNRGVAGDLPVPLAGLADHGHDLVALAVVGEPAVLAHQGFEPVQPVQQPAGAGRAADRPALDLDPDRAGVG